MEHTERAPLTDLVRELFGKAVRELRQARGLTQAQLAVELTGLGVQATQTTIAKIERGDRPTSISEAAVIANYFSVPIQSLFPIDLTASALHHLALLVNRFTTAINERDELVYQVEVIRARIADILDEWDANVEALSDENREVIRSMGMDPQSSWENGMRDTAQLPEDLAAAVWAGAPRGDERDEGGIDPEAS